MAPRSSKATLADVATRAGVSRTTASYILNGRTSEMRISTDAEGRVLTAVADLGYRPNRNARSLRTSVTSTIGLISDHVASGQFASQMVSGASAAARELDHLLVIGETEGDPRLEQMLLEEMVDREVDGIVYTTLTYRQLPVPRALSRVRHVLLNCLDTAAERPAVVPDEHGGGRTAVDVLLAAGVDDPIVVVGEDPTVDALAGPLRMAGVRARLGEHGRAVAEVVSCDWSVAAAREAVAGWWRAGGRARGLVCMNDRVAMGTYQALAECGLSVPGDVAVVSFDGSDLAGWLRPHVHSVALPFAELGATAVRTLLAPDPGVARVHRLPMPLVPGASV